MPEVYFKFYTRDWRSDRALKACTPLTRLVWFEMMLVMRDANPKGFFVGLCGEPIDVRRFAADINVKPSDVRKAILELDNRKVSSTDAQGRIYCRKIVREAAKELQAQENGSLGGNPLLVNQMTPLPVNQKQRDPVNPNGYPTSGNNQKPIPDTDSLRSSALAYGSWPDDVMTLKGLGLLFVAAFANCRDPIKAEKYLPHYLGVLAQVRKQRHSIEAAWRACEDAREANGGKPLFAAMIKTALSFLPPVTRQGRTENGNGSMDRLIGELRNQETR